ncbi:MAG: hypothetical protein WA137_01935 [Methanothrix sp.]
MSVTKMDLLKALALMMAAQQNIIEMDADDKEFIAGVLGGHALKD